MLEDTGERIIPKTMKPTNGMLLEHLARYYFATPYVRGRVLDIACGTGYGSQMVAKIQKEHITEIIAADINEETLLYAKQNHYHPLVSFHHADVLDSDLATKIGTFDTILSFETIEHINNDVLFIDNMFQLLNKNGTLIISTPFGLGRGKPCKSPFHVHQLTEREFKDLFSPFANVTYYYQRGVTFESEKRDLRYPFGIAICTKG
ncbi:class I SAM-dependent methyltransferase [Bacillus alkalicellulosilyticus]|uniref:class I SAM-dependent methyltransferase n=1 Tax=Alkalihalobacterium alkalicellulosilyticum TaxID=1912214 RepID=UPI0009984074|nr:class I SAM-dependent methyltransferase [Bacillus alkalicellulosilyticus]